MAGCPDATPSCRPSGRRSVEGGGEARGYDGAASTPAATTTPATTTTSTPTTTSAPPSAAPNFTTIHLKLHGPQQGCVSTTTMSSTNLRGRTFRPSVLPPSRADLVLEVAQLRSELKLAQREAEAAKGQVLMDRQAAEELRLTRARQNRFEVNAAEAHARREAGAATHDLSKLKKRWDFAISQRDTQASLVNKQRETMKEMVSKRAVFDVQAKMQTQLDNNATLRRAAEDECAALQALLDETRAQEAATEEALDGATADSFKLEKVLRHFSALKLAVGVRADLAQAPPREPLSTASQELSRHHMATVLRGRGEGPKINLVAEALHRCGYLERLFNEADRCQHMLKAVVKKAVGKLQIHWTPRHAVHVWDRLELTRSKMETLRHLLSHVYDPEINEYMPIRLWQNPTDDSDFVLTAALAGRHAREKEFAAIAEQQNIIVGANGRCERDAVECTERLYSNYRPALRKLYSVARPAQPVLFLDGTGGALGRGICHGEMGCADFIAVGDSDAKQSRATLQPLFLYEGTDHTGDLRSNLDVVWKSYNLLVEQGYFTRWDPDDPSVTEQLPCRAITAADMQGAKSEYGMAACSHSVWCKCQRGEQGPQHRYPDHTFETYEEMLKYIEEEVGCQFKTFEDMCSWAHYSPGVARGHTRTPSHAHTLTSSHPHTLNHALTPAGPHALTPSCTHTCRPALHTLPVLVLRL